MQDLPIELINHILSYRPRHPTAECIIPYIKSWGRTKEYYEIEDDDDKTCFHNDFFCRYCCRTSIDHLFGRHYYIVSECW